MNASDFIVVICTFPEPELAESILNDVMEQRLAACVQMYPSDTMYRFNGEIHHDRETVLHFKTRRTLFKKLERFLFHNHPFAIPEIIALPIVEAHTPYLKWIKAETTLPHAKAKAATQKLLEKAEKKKTAPKPLAPKKPRTKKKS